MADIFEERGKGYEAKFRLEQELLFKADSRRNRLLAEWLAEKFGMTETETKAYVKDVVVSDLEEPGFEDVVRKVMKDIEARKANITEKDVRKQIRRLNGIAEGQVQSEFKASP